MRLPLGRLLQARREAKDSHAQRLLRPTTRLKRALRLALIGAAAVALSNYLRFSDLENSAKTVWKSIYAKNQGGEQSLAEKASSQVTIVLLSDSTFDSLGIPPPVLPRSYHARLIKELTKAGAKVIAFDLLFHTDKPEDKELAQAAKESGRVIWPCLFQDYGTPGQKLLGPNENLLKASPHVGHIQVPFDTDQRTKVEQVEPVLWTADKPKAAVPSMSVEAVRLASGLENTPLKRVDSHWECGPLIIPLDAGGERFTIKYYGKKSETEEGGNPGAVREEESFHPVPYEDVLNGLTKDTLFKPSSVAGKIVLVGNTTESANDMVDTPVGRIFGVEVHAHAIATLLEGNFIRDASAPMDLAALILPVAIFCGLAMVLHLRWLSLASPVMMAGYTLLNLWLFVDMQESVNLVAPLAAMAMATAGILVERGVIEEQEKKRACALLQRHLSPQIAAYILENPDMLHTRRVNATVLFSDIRGFTAMSEKLSPEEVVVRLNEYLQAMTDCVFEHDGAVDKYIGDAIMALFNTPLFQEDHVRRAVATAIDMQTALLKLQVKWEAEGLPSIDIGIGINTGDMVVGYMGSQERLDFTVIGDSVNLASRVESLNKEMKSRILITKATYEVVKDEIEVRGPMVTHVKGKEEDVFVYEVYGWRVTP